jgi:hypothetical protein
MTEAAHAQAGRLMDEERIEGILSDANQAWLAEHLRNCEQCSHAAGKTNRALASWRSAGIEVPPGLASRTQMRVRLRADSLREGGIGNKLLWAVSGVSWVAGVASAPWVWRGFAWMGEHTGMPKTLWVMGFVLWWAIPALFAAGAVLADRRRGFGQELD